MCGTPIPALPFEVAVDTGTGEYQFSHLILLSSFRDQSNRHSKLLDRRLLIFNSPQGIFFVATPLSALLTTMEPWS